MTFKTLTGESTLSRKTLAKIVAWVAGAIATLAVNGAFGKYSSAVVTVAPLISAGAVHLAADTSAGHPNG